MYKKFEQFWFQERSLLILLIILSVHMFVILPLGQHTAFGKIISFVFYLFLLVAGMRYLAINRRLTSAIVVSAICIAFLSTRLFSESLWITIASDALLLTFCALLAWIVLSKTFSEGPITIYRIEGSIVGYLLMGLFFANLQYLIFHVEGITAFKGLEDPDVKEFLYFSLTTLTTVGYGDISPAIPISRSIANVEALVGQLYPAILIGRLVSMEISGRSSKT